MLEDAGGRKFLLAVLLIVAFTIFVILGKMEVGQYITAVLVDMGIFSGANAAQKFAPIRSEDIEKKE